MNERDERAHRRALALANDDEPDHPVRELLALVAFMVTLLVVVAWVSGYLSISVSIR